MSLPPHHSPRHSFAHSPSHRLPLVRAEQGVAPASRQQPHQGESEDEAAHVRSQSAQALEEEADRLLREAIAQEQELIRAVDESQAAILARQGEDRANFHNALKEYTADSRMVSRSQSAYTLDVGSDGQYRAGMPGKRVIEVTAVAQAYEKKLPKEIAMYPQDYDSPESTVTLLEKILPPCRPCLKKIPGERKTQDIKNIVMVLRRMPFFAKVSSKALEKLAPFVEYEFRSPESEIFSQGDPADYLYVLLVGQIRISVDERVIQRPKACTYFGLLSPSATIRCTTVVTESDCELILIHRMYLKELQPFWHPLFQEKAIFIQKQSLFRFFPPPALEGIANYFFWIVLRKDELMTREGVPDGTMYFIRKGHCLLVKDMPFSRTITKQGVSFPFVTTKRVILGEAGPGHSVGDMSALTGCGQYVTAIAQSNMQAIGIRRSNLLQRLHPQTVELLRAQTNLGIFRSNKHMGTVVEKLGRSGWKPAAATKLGSVSHHAVWHDQGGVPDSVTNMGHCRVRLRKEDHN